MSTSCQNQSDDRFDEILGEYFEAAERGPVGDWRELARRYPEYASQFEQFFADADAVHVNVGKPLDHSKSRVRHRNDTPTFNLGERRKTSTFDTFPRRFGNYELIGELARGGMGVVYRARQLSVHRTVAVKMLLAGSNAGSENRRRFLLEAEASARLDHTNIVPIYEVGEHEGQMFFSMKMIEGGSLADLLRSEHWRPGKNKNRWIAWLMIKISRAVDFAHIHGVVHRDLKPGNILLEMRPRMDDVTQVAVGGRRKSPGGSSIYPATVPLDGSGINSVPSVNAAPKSDVWFLPLKNLVPYVTDFGLAKMFDDDSQLTQSGAIVGTPNYMSPEQAAGAKEIGASSDVFSLGAILYHLLTGKRPFDGETPMATLDQVRTKEPEKPGAIVPVDRDLELICLKCLEKDPKSRYHSAALLANDLDRYLKKQPIKARPPLLAERVRRWRKRYPAAALLLVLLPLFALVAVGAFVLANHLRDTPTVVVIPTTETTPTTPTTPTTLKTTPTLPTTPTTPTTRTITLPTGITTNPIDLFAMMQGLMKADELICNGQLKEAEEMLNKLPKEVRKEPWEKMMRRCRSTIVQTDVKRVTCLGFSPDGKWIVAGTASGRVHVWEADSRKAVGELELSKKAVSCLSVANKRIAAGDILGNIAVWTIEDLDAKPLLKKSRDKGRIVGIALVEEDTLLSADQELIQWDLTGKAQPAALPNLSGAIAGFTLDPKQKQLFCAIDNKIKVFDLAKVEVAKEIPTGLAVICLACNPDGTAVFAGTMDLRVHGWRVADGKQVPIAPRADGGAVEVVLQLAFDNADRACGLSKTQIQLYSRDVVLRYEAARRAPTGAKAVCYSLDGRYLLVGYEEGIIWMEVKDLR